MVEKPDILNDDRVKILSPQKVINGTVLKVLSDHRLVLLERASNNLHLIDMRSNHVMKSIQGKNYKRNLHEMRINIGITPSSKHILWRRTEVHLALVNVQDFFIEKEISQFWPDTSSEILFDSFGVSNDSLSNIICVNKTKDYGNLICHYTGSGRIRHVSLNEIIKGGKQLFTSESLHGLGSHAVPELGPHLSAQQVDQSHRFGDTQRSHSTAVRRTDFY